MLSNFNFNGLRISYCAEVVKSGNLTPPYHSDSTVYFRLHMHIGALLVLVAHAQCCGAIWLRGDDITSCDQMLQFDWLMMSHDYI